MAAVMPPTLAQVGAFDTLAVEGRDFVAALWAGGVEAVLTRFVGADHDFIMNRTTPADRFGAI